MKKIYLYTLVAIIISFFGFLSLYQNNNYKYINKILTIVFLFFLFYLFSFNRYNFDYNNYLNIFKAEAGVEIGYIYVIKFIKKINGTHEWIIFFIGIYIFSYFILNLLNRLKYLNVLLGLYFLDCFVYDINQIRNTVCYFCILYGLEFLKNKKNKQYLFFNLLAILFQRIGVVYLFYYILNNFKLKYYYKIVTILFFSGFLIIPLLKIILMYFFPRKATYYFNIEISYGFIVYYLLLLLDIFLLYFNNLLKKDTVELKYILFPIIFLPYTGLSIEIMHRIYRNTLIIKWAYLLKNIENKTPMYKILTVILLYLGALVPVLGSIYKNRDQWIDFIECLKNTI